METELLPNVERRKHVRLKIRSDLVISEQRYEGKKAHVIKDPVGLKYYRFNDQEFFVLKKMDGATTLEAIQKAFEREFRPHRLTLEDLESFARQLTTSGLVQQESSPIGKHLYQKQRKQRILKKFATASNILYLKIPVFDPDRILTWMLRYLSWMFTRWFLILSFSFMLAAALLVTIKFDVFWEKLPARDEFFRFRTLLYMWLSLGVVKVIHEFGHGLSCKAFGGECHEMGALLLCFSPALYCNVSDAWVLPNKWKRILISFAGIYVELMIAAAATFVWWYTPHLPYVNNVALVLMTLCSVSTFIFNANPLMRFDGYYILADWMEVPNLRDRCNRYLSNQFQEICLGIETQPEPYMAPGRRVMFVTYAIVSYIYRWVVTFSILLFLSEWLKPYKLETLSTLLAFLALGTMIFWPMYRLVKNIRRRGRLPDMKMNRVLITTTIFAGFLAAFLLVPLPVSRIMETGLVQVHERNVVSVHLPDPGILMSLNVTEGEWVPEGKVLAVFRNPDLEAQLADASAKHDIERDKERLLTAQYTALPSDPSGRLKLDYEAKIIAARGLRNKYEKEREVLQAQINRLRELKAPCAGYVMGLPKRDDLTKSFDKSNKEPFCTIGDSRKLRLIVPVEPTNYRLLKEDLPPDGALDVSIHIAGRSDRLFHGRVTRLPESDEKNIPLPLSQRGGGSIAVVPGADPSINTPLSQFYMIVVEVTDNDGTLTPGQLARAKIHCRWRSAAWWCWRKLGTMLKLGLI